MQIEISPVAALPIQNPTPGLSPPYWATMILMTMLPQLPFKRQQRFRQPLLARNPTCLAHARALLRWQLERRLRAV